MKSKQSNVQRLKSPVCSLQSTDSPPRSSVFSFQSSVTGSKSKVQSLKSKVCRREAAAAFTLIELLVAMAILMVMVLMMSNLFQQSTRAWDAGLRQAEVGLEARAVMNMIQREASKALPDEANNFSSERTLSFSILNQAGEKEAITYYLSGDSLSRLVKDDEGVTLLDVTLLDNVKRFNVSNASIVTGFPDLVEIELALDAKSNTGRVRVYSFGPDEKDEDGSGDDIDTGRLE